MKALYLDNLRGFDDTLINFKDVNFLVGENSTGKTSILSLFRIASQYKFWNAGVFPDDFQNFDDLVSVNSEDRSNFTIGVYSEMDLSIEMMISTYHNHEGIPRLDKHTFLCKDRIVKFFLDYSSRKISYTYEPTKNLKSHKLFEKVRKVHLRKSEKLLHDITDERLLNLAMQDFGLTRAMLINSLNIKNDDDSPVLQLFFFHNEPKWIAPIRAKPERTYDQYKSFYSPEGSHVPYRLSEFLHDSDSLDRKNRKKLLESLERFGLDSGLFKEIKVKRIGGNDKSSPFHLQVILNEKPLQIINVGYGVAQVLPILVETLTERKNSLFAIQQPEVHLHPKAQASLGAYFYHLSKNDEKSFLIETHSDFLIDRYRMEYARDEEKKDSPAQLLFFKRNSAGKNEIHVIDIEPDGSYSADQPKEFREFFINEGLEMLNL